MSSLARFMLAAFAATAISAWPLFADEGKVTIGGDGTVTAEVGGAKMESNSDGTSLEYGGVKVSDGKDGSSIEAGGIKVSEGKDGNRSVEVGDSVGGRVGAEASAGGDNWNAEAQAGASAEAGWSVGADEEGNVGVKTGAKVGADASVTVGVNGQIGDDQNNVHGSGEVKLSAEVVAEIAAQLTVNEDGTVVAKAEAHAGASVSADATIKGGVTVWGVPVDVVLTGGVSAGAEAGAAAGAEFDAKTGKLKVTLEASAVLGVGAHGNVSVEIGVVQLAQALGTGLGNAVEKIGEGVEYVGGKIGEGVDKVGDAVGDLWNWIGEKFSGESGKGGNSGGGSGGSNGGGSGGDSSDPFDSDPQGGGGDSGSPGKGTYQGIKPLKLIN